MADPALFASLESDLNPRPEFYVDPPDGRRDWPEIQRQATLFRLMHQLAPRIVGFAVPNAGKRNPFNARREGVVAGVFDTQWCWRDGLSAWIEMKGYTSAGRAGLLSDAQIAWGNRMAALGHRVACFYDPYAAVDWLRDQGFPIRDFVAPAPTERTARRVERR
jgi:hypothetical protein